MVSSEFNIKTKGNFGIHTHKKNWKTIWKREMKFPFFKLFSNFFLWMWIFQVDDRENSWNSRLLGWTSLKNHQKQNNHFSSFFSFSSFDSFRRTIMVHIDSILTFSSTASRDVQTVLSQGRWDLLHLFAFDAPTRFSERYEQRIKFLQDHIFASRDILFTVLHLPASSFVSIVENQVVKSKEHWKDRLESILAKKGEGLFFRKPSSNYLDKYSFLKYTVRKLWMWSAKNIVTGVKRQ